MPKKYKHIVLPNKLFSNEKEYNPDNGRNIQERPKIDFKKHGTLLKRNISGVKRYSSLRKDLLKSPEDKKQEEITVKFYGYPNDKFINKYHINVYQVKDDSIIYGKISNTKITPDAQSDFERLEVDAKIYTEDSTLKSYFDGIRQIKPLTLEQVIDLDLKKYFQENPQESTYVDVSFISSSLSEEKINQIKEVFQDKFISKVNTNFVNFCRLKASYSELKDATLKFSGITNIDFAPNFVFETSEIIQNFDDVEIENPTSGNPVFIFDTAVNENHKTIKGALLEHNNLGTRIDHGTAVASLAVCGATISPKGKIVQKNPAIAVDLLSDPKRFEEILLSSVEKYSQKYPLLLINLSINDYSSPFYNRNKKVSNLTLLLEELAWKYNCLFFISTGNAFQGWDKDLEEMAYDKGFPKYFHYPFTCILPPSDSINNISVGAVAYQASPNSLAKQENPTPITRRNLTDNCFIKPDLVHYDGNFIINSLGRLESEDNGIFLAGEKETQIKKSCGTSYTAPLVTFAAGIIHNQYPSYKNTTIKALLIHSANKISAKQITSEIQRRRLVGFGMPDLEKALYSLNTASSLIIEDKIGINKSKRIKIPIPKCIAGSAKKRLRIHSTLVYNPPVNPKNLSKFNPFHLALRIIREDGAELTSSFSRDRLSDAFSKSNVKKYVHDWNTKNHTGTFWELEITSVSKIDDWMKLENVPGDYEQNYSVIVTIEDIAQDDTIDLHQEISQMIEVEVPVVVEASVSV